MVLNYLNRWATSAYILQSAVEIFTFTTSQSEEFDGDIAWLNVGVIVVQLNNQLLRGDKYSTPQLE